VTIHGYPVGLAHVLTAVLLVRLAVALVRRHRRIRNHRTSR
jgi:hypothetical protein